MPIIEVNHVTKEHRLGQLLGLKTSAFNQWRRLTGQPIEERAPFMALDDVSFNIEAGEIVGIIGHNGAGKRAMLNPSLTSSPLKALNLRPYFTKYH